MDIKPGYKTTEFWLTLFSAGMGAAVLVGVMTQEESAEWFALLAPVIMLIVPIIAYTQSRGKAKATDNIAIYKQLIGDIPEMELEYTDVD